VASRFPCKNSATSASVTLKSTNTPFSCTHLISLPITIMETSHASQQTLFPISNFSSEDSLVKRFLSLANVEVLTILVELCSSSFAALREISNLGFCCLRMSKDYSITKGGKHSELSSARWMSWGMTVNGKCLTANISAFPKIEKGCSLSDILEENPDPKYFLSETFKKYLTRRSEQTKDGHKPRFHTRSKGTITRPTTCSLTKGEVA